MNLKNAKYILILLLISPVYLTSAWKVNLDGKERSYTSIKCVDELNCVATCYSQLDEYNYKDSAYIIKTSNGGNTWFNVYYKLQMNVPDSIGPFECSEVEYPSKSTIIASSNFGVVVKSTDGGNNWKYSLIEKQLNIKGIHMSDEKNGWLFGFKTFWINNRPKYIDFLYKTNDAWDTWELYDFKNLANSKSVVTMASPSRNLVVISAFKNDSCFLFRSTDFGESWSQSPWTLDIESIWFLNDSIGYCTGGFPVEGDSGNSKFREIIYKTRDGGVNWFLIRDTINKQHAGLRFIRFFDEKHGIACGYDRILMKTNDSGKTWHYENVGISGSYTTVLEVSYPSINKAFAILALEDLWRNEEMTEVEDYTLDYSEFYLSPSPASDFIEITLPWNDHTLKGVVEGVRIFNIFGEEVSTPSLLRNATPQEGNFKIDVSALSPGVYFVRVGEKVGKFLKM